MKKDVTYEIQNYKSKFERNWNIKIKTGGDTILNVIKNVIMKFDSDS